MIKDFEKSPYKGYVQKRPKHEPTNSYFYIARQLAKCMMRYDAINSYIDPVRTKMNGTKHILISHVFSMDKSESKEFLTKKNLFAGLFYK